MRQNLAILARSRDARASLDALAATLALVLAVLLPLALLHTRAGAEIGIGLVDGLFLAHVWATADRAWLRTPFTLAAAAWWLWLILASARGTGGLALALVAFRLPLLATALGHWALRSPSRARAAWLALAFAFAWIALETWHQYFFGQNLLGYRPWGDGALTGPFYKPRAGPALILLFFPVLIPLCLRLRARPFAAAALLAFAAATVLIVGQRMPSLLLLLGLVFTALAVPKLRLWLAAPVAAGALLLALMPRIAPAEYQKLILHTREQLSHFGASAYAQIWRHAAAMAAAHPWFGQGFDAFRRACATAPHDDLTCNLHPHNFYLEAAVNGGYPALAAFTAMALAALFRLAPGLRAGPESAGLFLGAAIAFWPIASTSAFTSMPNGGWIFLIAGLGFAFLAAPPRLGYPKTARDP